MTTPAGDDPKRPEDLGFENRSLILASLAPRPTARPARRGAARVGGGELGETDGGPGALERAWGLVKRGASRGYGAYSKVVPKEKRRHVAGMTIGLIVVLVVAIIGLRKLAADAHVPAQTAAPTTSQPVASHSNKAVPTPVILTGITGKDFCPRDENWRSIDNALDLKPATAWRCTRVNNEDGQNIMFDFGRQITLDQVRGIFGFDCCTASGGPDEWGKNKIPTKIDIYFPKELRRPPLSLYTEGARDWRWVNVVPPATVSRLAIRIVETVDPPTSSTPTATPGGGDEVTTVAIGDIQFIGTSTIDPGAAAAGAEQPVASTPAG